MIHKILNFFKKIGLLHTHKDSYKGKGSNSLSEFDNNKEEKKEEKRED